MNEPIQLNAEESKVFNEHLENPPEPNDALKAAMARYKEGMLCAGTKTPE